MVYGHANGRDIEEACDEVARYHELGYLAIRAQSGVPGLASTYGVSRDKMFYEPADSDMPTENTWSSEKYIDHVPTLFEKLRERFGFELHLLHDVHHRLTPIEAARVGKSLEPYRLFWLEDAVPAENQEGFRLIRQHTVTALAVGEVFNTIWDCKTLIEEHRSTISAPRSCMRAALRTCAASRTLPRCTMCAPAATAPPTCRRYAWARPCILTAGCRISACRNTCGIPRRPTRYFPRLLAMPSGYMYPGEAPGHGVDIDEKLAAKFPTSAPIFPLTVCRTARCGIGERKFPWLTMT